MLTELEYAELSKRDSKTLTNEERSAIEVYEFVAEPPQRYFLYIKEEGPYDGTATTWTGERLGAVTFGRAYRSNFGDKRIPVWIQAINGEHYQGTYYADAGDYARVRRMRARA